MTDDEFMKVLNKMIFPPDENAVREMDIAELITQFENKVRGPLEMGSTEDVLADEIIRRLANLTIGTCKSCETPLVDSANVVDGYCCTPCRDLEMGNLS